MWCDVAGEGLAEADVARLMRAVFSEYPAAFQGDPAQFVDIVRALALGAATEGTGTCTYMCAITFIHTHAEYKQLLSGLKCQASNAQYMQWLLAIRSFALVSFVTAVVNFFRNMCEAEHAAGVATHGTQESGYIFLT